MEWSVDSFFGLQELEWCREDRGLQTQHVVDVTKVLQLVWVRNVSAVPSDKDVAGMPCGEGEVTRVSDEAGRHQFVSDVKLDRFVDLGAVFQEGKRGREGEAFRALGFRGEMEFRENSVGSDELILRPGLLPPMAGPIAHGDEFGPGPTLVIEARNGGLDVNEFAQRSQGVVSLRSL